MPRNRADVGRDVKIDEIVDAARCRLVEDGYPGLSVAALARELGLAQAAVYWYFPTKDHLFLAAVERIFRDVLAGKPHQRSCVDSVVWFSDRLSEFQDLRMAVRDRARKSPLVRKFDRDMTAVLRSMLHNALSAEVDEGLLDETVDAVLALCDGVLMSGLDARRRRRLIRFGFQRLTAAQGEIED